jgi:CheY-like chemotaxis protein
MHLRTGLRIFLVEDEVMIRMMIADMVVELGHVVVGEAGGLGEALEKIEQIDFDFAILDVNLLGEMITPVVDRIRALNRPFIFATGYAKDGIPAGYRGYPALQKPFSLEALAKVFQDLPGETRKG